MDRRENAYEIPRYNVSVAERMGRVKKRKGEKRRGRLRGNKGERGGGDGGEKEWAKPAVGSSEALLLQM